jgi:transposase
VATTLVMSLKERDGAAILKEVNNGCLSTSEAAGRLDLSRRQVLRLLKRYRAQGDAGLIHRLLGKSSNRGCPKRVKSRVLELYRTPAYRN